jgi:hypothetical protein
MDPSEENFHAAQTAQNGCAWRNRLGAFHDGELDSASAAQVESHLASCQACRAELDEIRELSSLARMIGAEGISPFGMRRIHQAIDAEPRFSVLKFAGILTGLAASALVIGSAWLWEVPETRPPQGEIVIVPDHRSDWTTLATTLEVRQLPRTPFEAREKAQMLAYADFSNWMVENLAGR